MFVLTYAFCRSKRSLKRLAVAFTSISSWVACISGLLQKAKERAKSTLNVALDFENRATRACFSCRNASYWHKRCPEVICRSGKFTRDAAKQGNHGYLAHVSCGTFRACDCSGR